MSLREVHRYQLTNWLILPLVVLAAWAVAAVFLLAAAAPLGSPSQAPHAAQQLQQSVVLPVSATSNTLFFGNMYFGRYINDWSMKSPLKYAYPFSRLNEFHRENYNAWIAGLECPSVAGFHQTSAQEDATLSFNCDPQYLGEAKKWFTAVTLANNHTDNRGADGFAETKVHLEENNIQYFGHYDPTMLSDLCDVVALPVSVTMSDNSLREAQLPVAICGYHGVFRLPTQEALAVMKDYAAYMPVIAMPHMGKEYVATPDQIKTDLYRSMIDAGADMVLGDHPHVTQTSEGYKGKLIVYSMGNFMFDQQDQVSVTRSAAINVRFNTKDASKEQLAAWIALGKTCASYHDNCLSQAKTQQLQRLPYEFHFEIVATNDAQKITKPGDTSDAAMILGRLQWAKTITQLRAPSTAR